MVVLFLSVLIIILFYYFRKFFFEKLEMINIFLNKLLPAILFFKGIYFFFFGLVWSKDEDDVDKIG